MLWTQDFIVHYQYQYHNHNTKSLSPSPSSSQGLPSRFQTIDGAFETYPIPIIRVIRAFNLVDPLTHHFLHSIHLQEKPEKRTPTASKRKKGAEVDAEENLSDVGSTTVPSSGVVPSLAAASSAAGGWMASALALPGGTGLAVKEEFGETESVRPAKTARRQLKHQNNKEKWSPCPICLKGPSDVKDWLRWWFDRSSFLWLGNFKWTIHKRSKYKLSQSHSQIN